MNIMTENTEEEMEAEKDYIEASLEDQKALIIKNTAVISDILDIIKKYITIENIDEVNFDYETLKDLNKLPQIAGQILYGYRKGYYEPIEAYESNALSVLLHGLGMSLMLFYIDTINQDEHYHGRQLLNVEDPELIKQYNYCIGWINKYSTEEKLEERK